MKKTILLAALAMSLATSDALANHDDACAIWLCLPTAFTTGCSAAKHEFKHRIRHMKPPLPDIASCIVKTDDNDQPEFTFQQGFSALIPEHQECTHWHHEGGKNGNNVCDQFATIKKQIIDGTTCVRHKDSLSTPLGCTQTLKWVKTFQNGQPMMKKYYY